MFTEVSFRAKFIKGGEFIFCQGFNIGNLKENQIKLKDKIAGISKIIYVSVVHGWKVWLLGEAGGSYTIRHFNL